MSLLGPLIGAGASILGGLLGGEESSRTKQKSRSKTRSTSDTTNKLRLGALVRTAERNGFNPMTLLNSGVASAFVNSSTTGFSKSKGLTKGKGSTSSSAPLASGIASAGQIIGGAVSGGGVSQGLDGAGMSAATFQGIDPIIDSPAAKAAEDRLIQSQLNDRAAGSLTATPDWSASLVDVAGIPALSKIPTPGEKPVMPETSGFWNLKASDAAPASKVSDEYGDIFEEIGGLWKFGRNLDATWGVSDGIANTYNASKSRMDAKLDPYSVQDMSGNNVGKIWDAPGVTVATPSYAEFSDTAPLAVTDPLKKEYYDYTRQQGNW